MVTVEIIREVLPYAFGAVGVYSLYSIADTINENLYAIRKVMLDNRELQNSNDLYFETVTCGGCGESVRTGVDGFTPIEHDCKFNRSFGLTSLYE